MMVGCDCTSQLTFKRCFVSLDFLTCKHLRGNAGHCRRVLHALQAGDGRLVEKATVLRDFCVVTARLEMSACINDVIEPNGARYTHLAPTWTTSGLCSLHKRIPRLQVLLVKQAVATKSRSSKQI